jgi:hypothetical protein
MGANKAHGLVGGAPHRKRVTTREEMHLTKTGGTTIRRPRPRAIRAFIGALNIALVTLLLGAMPALADDSSASTATNPPAQGNAQPNTACPTGPDAIQSYSFSVNGHPASDLWGIHPGDHVLVNFTIAPNCTDVQVSFASYSVPPGGFDLKTLQVLFSHDTGKFSSGEHALALAIDIPCSWQVDLAVGPVIEHLGKPDYYGPRLRVGYQGSGTCVSPSPSPTESIEASSSATADVHSLTSEPSGVSGVLAASVTNPNTGRSVDIATGILALFMVLGGFALVAETRRRGIAPATGPSGPLEPELAAEPVEADLPPDRDDRHGPGSGSVIGMLTLLTIVVAFGIVVGRRRH